jgi:hypothetical protein
MAIPVLSCADTVGGDHPSNLRVRGSSKFPWRGVRPTANWPRAVAGIKLAWRPPKGLVGLLLGVHRRPQVASDHLALGVAGRGLRVWIMAGGVDGASDYLLKVNWIASPTPGGMPTSRPDRTEGGEVPADSPVLADTATLDSV